MGKSTHSKQSEASDEPVESDLEFPPSDNEETASAPAWSRYVVTSGGRVEVALWPATVNLGNGRHFETFNVSARRSFFNKQEGAWKTVKGLRLDDVPALSLLLQQAHAWALEQLQAKK